MHDELILCWNAACTDVCVWLGVRRVYGGFLCDLRVS